MSDVRSQWPDVDLFERTQFRGRVLVPLGRSGDARIYHATAPLGEIVVADWLVKVYKLPSTSDTRLDPVTRDRPAVELAANATVWRQNCESLESSFDVGEVDGYRFMSFRDRGNALALEQIFMRQHQLHLRDALYIIELLAAALCAVHESKLVHRNIHPRSALVRWDPGSLPSAFLTDLSYVKFLEGKHVGLATEPFGGPDGYRAPEQRGTGEHGLPCDVYALGRLAYEVLAGRALPASFFTRRPPRVSKLRGDVIPELANVLERCLDHKPAKRPSSHELTGWARSARIASQTGTLMIPAEMEKWLGSLGGGLPDEGSQRMRSDD